MEAFDNLAHQIALLCIKPEGGRVRRRTELALATAAGALGELAIQERVSLDGKKVRVHDTRPTEDPLLDIMLQVLADQPDRRPMRILDAARKTYMNQALTELVSNGWATMTPGSGLLGDRYQVLDTERLARIKAMVTAGFHDPVGSPTRESLLAGLVFESQMGRELVPELNWWQRWKAGMALRKRHWVVKAVADVIAARASAAAGAA